MNHLNLPMVDNAASDAQSQPRVAEPPPIEEAQPPYYEDFDDVSACHLRTETRIEIQTEMQPLFTFANAQGITQDVVGLCALMGIPNENLERFLQMDNDNQWKAFFAHYLTLSRNSVKDFLCNMVEAGHFYFVNEAVFRQRVIEDVENCRTLAEARIARPQNCSSEDSYDYFVSASDDDDDDFEFALEIVRKLQANGFTVRFPGLHYSAGVKYEEWASLIDNCKIVVIVFSPSYLESDDCRFQMSYAQSGNPAFRKQKGKINLVPIKRTTSTNIPKSFKNITYVLDVEFEKNRGFLNDKLEAALRISSTDRQTMPQRNSQRKEKTGCCRAFT